MKQIFSIFVVILVIPVCGDVFASPRWGDDFDWLGDTLQSSIPFGMTAYGDTIFCRSPVSMFAMVQTDSDSFHTLWNLTTPKLSTPALDSHLTGIGFTHLFRSGNRFYYGYPRAAIQWNGTDSPQYLGATHQGNTWFPDTAFTGYDLSPNGDSLGITFPIGYNYYYNFRPVAVNDFVLYADQVLRRDANGAYFPICQISTGLNETSITEWAIRWPYAYGVRPRQPIYADHDSLQLCVVKLDTVVPCEIATLFCQSNGFPLIIHDTLVTIKGRRWETWSLANPRLPVSLGLQSLPFRLSGIDSCTISNLWLGWGWAGGEIYINDSTLYHLIQLDSGITHPRFIDKKGTFDDRPPPFSGVTHTNFGWIIRTNGLHHFLGLYPKPDSLRGYRLDTLWQNRRPAGIDSSMYANAPPVISVTTLAHRDNQELICWKYTRYAVVVLDNVQAMHEIRWLPQGNFNSAMFNGDQVVQISSNKFKHWSWTWQGWQIDSLTLPVGGMYLKYCDHDRFVTTLNNDYYYFYKIVGDTIMSDGGIQIAANNINVVYAVRDSGAIVASDDSVFWFRKSLGVWARQSDFTLSRIRTATETNMSLDTLFLADSGVYVLPQSGAPYLLWNLPQEIFLQPDLEVADIENNSVAVHSWNQKSTTFYEHSNNQWYNRGTILAEFGGLFGDVFVATSLGTISSYRIPPYTSVEDPFIGGLPTSYELGKPYPNPFNSTIHFQFTIPKTDLTMYAIYDALGRQVYKRETIELLAGKYLTSWDGRNSSGTIVCSGVYFLRFQSGDFQSVKKVVLMK